MRVVERRHALGRVELAGEPGGVGAGVLGDEVLLVGLVEPGDEP